MAFKESKWRFFLILTGVYLLAYFYRVSTAVIAQELRVDLGLSASQLGSLSAGLFYAFALAQWPLGPLLDRFEGGRVIGVLGFVTAAGALLFAGATEHGPALAGRILIGVGTAGVLMGSLKVYTTWFSARTFATLVGLQVALGNTGNLLATAPLAWLSGHFGWRTVFVGCALLSAVGGAFVLWVVRDGPLAPKRSQSDLGAIWRNWRRLYRRADFWRVAVLAFFWYGGYMGMQGLWGGPYLRTVLGLERDSAARLLLMTAVGFIIGSPLAGRLSDRIWRSRKRLVMLGQGGLTLCLALLLGPLTHLPDFCRPLFFLVFGLCVATGPVLFAQVKELFPADMAATAMTAMNFFVVLGAALMQQGMGLILAFRQASGATPAEAFRTAFAMPLVGLGLAWIWYWRCRDTSPDSPPHAVMHEE